MSGVKCIASVRHISKRGGKTRHDFDSLCLGLLTLAEQCIHIVQLGRALLFAHKEELGDWAWHLKPIGGAC
ncbi:hypothetical protein Taro_006126 [Colocasia esculenta]|uniref:Uncharacterized protein n=1 Tax=Colocasia esculenta TaxID=4460 RepID=A0A843TQ52_COLES|nr:hypothetical protein [Colocasia esculenta]